MTVSEIYNYFALPVTSGHSSENLEGAKVSKTCWPSIVPLNRMRRSNTGHLASTINESGISYDVCIALNKYIRGFPFEREPLSAATA